MWTRAEIQQKLKRWSFVQVYEEFDKDKNGNLSSAELASFFTSLLNKIGVPFKVHDWQAKLALKFVDKDGDGSLSEAESYACFGWILAKITGQQPMQYHGQKWNGKDSSLGYAQNQQPTAMQAQKMGYY